jgi:hypothetical protein
MHFFFWGHNTVARISLALLQPYRYSPHVYTQVLPLLLRWRMGNAHASFRHIDSLHGSHDILILLQEFQARIHSFLRRMLQC